MNTMLRGLTRWSNINDPRSITERDQTSKQLKKYSMKS